MITQGLSYAEEFAAVCQARGLRPRTKPIPLLETGRGHLSCAHRGKIEGKVGCVSCNKAAGGDGAKRNIQLKVYECRLHGNCMAAENGEGFRSCASCADRTMPVTHVEFRMGLGDAVQYTAVLRHARAQRPDRPITIITSPHHAPIFEGLVDEVLTHEQAARHRIMPDVRVSGAEAMETFARHPATKVEAVWLKQLGLTPDLALLRYQVQVTEPHRSIAAAYLSRFAKPDDAGKFPVAVIHSQGASWQDRKNLPHDDALAIARGVAKLGLRPLLLDLDGGAEGLSPWGEREGVARITRGDALLWSQQPAPHVKTTAALLSLCRLVVGIDSSPQKIAAALDTPTVAVWRAMHPVHYLCPADHIINVIPIDHERHIRGDRGRGLNVLYGQYRVAEYPPGPGALAETVCMAARLALAGPPSGSDIDAVTGHRIRLDNRQSDSRLVNEVYHRDAYGLRLLTFAPRHVVDIGAHCGVFARQVRHLFPDARIACVEANSSTLPALRANAADIGGCAVIGAACLGEASGRVEILDLTHEDRSAGSALRIDGVELKGGSSGIARALDVPVMTIEQVREAAGFPHIDLLKLDCEGSEESILGHADLSRVRIIVGEYHNRERFIRLVREHLPGWSFIELRPGRSAEFHLINNAWQPPAERTP